MAIQLHLQSKQKIFCGKFRLLRHLKSKYIKDIDMQDTYMHAIKSPTIK